MKISIFDDETHGNLHGKNGKNVMKMWQKSIKMDQILMLQHHNTHQIPIRIPKSSFKTIMKIIIFNGKMHGNLNGK